jgi:hypothetical protein
VESRRPKMRFNVEDFGCLADGRCLEEVFIEAGTALVSVGDGSVIAPRSASR